MVEAVSDVHIYSKKESHNRIYTLIENGADGKSVNLGESKLIGSTKRYFAYTKQQPSPREGHAVITDMKILSWSQTAPHDYYNIATTEDDSKEVFPSANKSLFVQFKRVNQAPEAITDIVILSTVNKAKVPQGYKRLPDINGFTICFRVGPFKGCAAGGPTVSTAPPKEPVAVAKTSHASLVDEYVNVEPVQQTHAQPPPIQQPPMQRQSSIQSRGPTVKACDGVDVRIAAQYDMMELMAKYDLNQNFNLMTISDIQDKFTYSFATEREIVNC
jgi:hypothetical protein